MAPKLDRAGARVVKCEVWVQDVTAERFPGAAVGAAVAMTRDMAAVAVIDVVAGKVQNQVVGRVQDLVVGRVQGLLAGRVPDLVAGRVPNLVAGRVLDADGGRVLDADIGRMQEAAAAKAMNEMVEAVPEANSPFLAADATRPWCLW